MSPANQTLLARFAAATSVFALIMVGVVAATSGGSGGGSGGGAAAAPPVTVSLTEFAITPATITVPEGTTLQVTNDGTMLHNLAVLDTDLLTADLPAGGTESLDLSSLAPGTYEVFCTIPGHKDSGMVGSLEIVPEGTEVAAAVNPAEATSIDELPENADGTHDHSAVELSGLESSDPLAQAISAEMEQGMTEGVTQFLDFATKYAEGDVEVGNVPLEPAEVLADGTKRFELTAAITDWEV
ncbi:MAG: cupredoxin domain-containing protein, partial [Acidimicrobiales bacterium]|nr:cupredoxin domain-containing protein [Acidimicrobiales bacterium]